MLPGDMTVSSDRSSRIDLEHNLQKLEPQRKRKHFSGKEPCVVEPVFKKHDSKSGIQCIKGHGVSDGNNPVNTLLLARYIEKCPHENLGQLLREKGTTAVQLGEEIKSLKSSLENAYEKLLTHVRCEAGTVDDSSGSYTLVKAEKDQETSSKSMHFKSRSGFIDRVLDLPDSISELVDSMSQLIKIRKEDIAVAQDIMPCVEMITTAVNGDNLMVLIEASVAPEITGLPAIHKLQKDDEVKMTLAEFADLQRYFREEVFNGKKVGFDFQDLSQLIFLRYALGGSSLFETFPGKLSFFIQNLIERVIVCRRGQEASLKIKPFFARVINGSGVAKSSVDFFTALLSENVNLEDLNAVVQRLDNLSHKALSIDQEKWLQATYRPLTEQ